MMKRFVIGDCHGRYEALIEVLKASNFNYQKDQLIILGDIVDGGNKTKELIDELLKINHTIFILGNHDAWFIKHIDTGWKGEEWLYQGGKETLKSYEKGIPERHIKFLKNHKIYHVDKDNNLFVHGGFEPELGLKDTPNDEILWNRNLIDYAMKNEIKEFNKIFVGHTSTQVFGNQTIPLKFNNLYMIDTGAGWNGRLCLVNIDT